MKVRLAIAGLLLAAAAAASTAAARGPAGDPSRLDVPDVNDERQGSEFAGNAPYDGRLAFVRIRYSEGFGGGFRRREPWWAHDYPTADIHLMKILDELTMAAPRLDGSNVLTFDDPELFNHPIAYLSEPGYWTMSDAESEGLREYLLKGGFVIFDDFRADHWYNLEAQMKRALPDARWVQLDHTHPIFHSFFEIDALDLLTSYGPYQPTYWALFEDNDPSRRVMAIANFNNDLGEYWEYSDSGRDPVDLSNEAYKYGVNYFLYGLMH